MCWHLRCRALDKHIEMLRARAAPRGQPFDTSGSPGANPRRPGAVRVRATAASHLFRCMRLDSLCRCPAKLLARHSQQSTLRHTPSLARAAQISFRTAGRRGWCQGVPHVPQAAHPQREGRAPARAADARVEVGGAAGADGGAEHPHGGYHAGANACRARLALGECSLPVGGCHGSSIPLPSTAVASLNSLRVSGRRGAPTTTMRRFILSSTARTCDKCVTKRVSPQPLAGAKFFTCLLLFAPSGGASQRPSCCGGAPDAALRLAAGERS